jgi:hypothetical protein
MSCIHYTADASDQSEHFWIACASYTADKCDHTRYIYGVDSAHAVSITLLMHEAISTYAHHAQCTSDVLGNADGTAHKLLSLSL